MTDQDPRPALLAAREAAEDRISGLNRELDAICASMESATPDDEHDPEGATIAFERARVQALLTRARTGLDELDAALGRYRAGSYGICQYCSGSISPARLEALPSARTCIGCAAAADRR